MILFHNHLFVAYKHDLNLRNMLVHSTDHSCTEHCGSCLRSRFGEHLRSIRNNSPGFPVAQHFNSTGHSVLDIRVRPVCSYATALTSSAEQRETRMIFQLRTVQPDGLTGLTSISALFKSNFLHTRDSSHLRTCLGLCTCIFN